MAETSFLPTEVVNSTTNDPGVTILYGPPKCGKTTLASTLPNNLILDLEKGTKYLNCMSLNIIGWSTPVNEDEEARQIRHEKKEFYMTEVGKEIMEQGKPYDFITVDTATELEDMIMPLAVEMYKKTPMGKSYDGNDVRELPRGAGYLYLRKAYKDSVEKIKKLANHIILIGHLKDTFVEKSGKEVQAKDLDLTGKIKQITCAGADAIGYVHWGKDGALLVNFKSADELLCGSRCAHLKGKEIQIATFNTDADELENVNWNLIFPDTIS